MDFASDAIATGRKIRVLRVIDRYTRERLSLEIDTSLASPRVTVWSLFPRCGDLFEAGDSLRLAGDPKRTCFARDQNDVQRIHDLGFETVCM